MRHIRIRIHQALKIDPQHIFNINNAAGFEKIALELFYFQAEYNPVYRAFLQYLRVKATDIVAVSDIPFMPVELFKHHKVYIGAGEPQKVFTSSGTTGALTSKHYVADLNLYEKSFSSCFERFYGDISKHCVLALLPSYLEREGSSLVYMADNLIKASGHPDSGFYMHNYSELVQKIKQLKAQQQAVLLLGVTYALMDLAEMGCEPGEHCIVMETGGMKGKRPEMLREELHGYLKQKMKITSVHSEYGMTELLSQAYSNGDGVFTCPPWMKVMIRGMNDPLQYLDPGRTGGMNVIDLANVYSCSFIATKDLGKIHPDGKFEILGRFDNSDIRGCNLLVS